MKYNTAIAALMSLTNEFYKVGKINKADLSTLIRLLYPVAPHITSEIWRNLGFDGDLDDAAWPIYVEAKTIEEVIKMAVQINGKVRGTIELAIDATKEEAQEVALKQQNIIAHTQGKMIVKEIYVPGKIYNIVVK